MITVSIFFCFLIPLKCEVVDIFFPRSGISGVFQFSRSLHMSRKLKCFNIKQTYSYCLVMFKFDWWMWSFSIRTEFFSNWLMFSTANPTHHFEFIAEKWKKENSETQMAKNNEYLLIFDRWMDECAVIRWKFHAACVYFFFLFLSAFLNLTCWYRYVDLKWGKNLKHDMSQMLVDYCLAVCRSIMGFGGGRKKKV